MECLRRLSKEPKSAFAFVHRAYNKDKKMAKQDLLRLRLEEAGGVVEWEEPETEEGELDDGGTNQLLSIKGVSVSEVATIFLLWYSLVPRPSSVREVWYTLHVSA